MAEFTANPQRRDPYKNFKFRVSWDGKFVASLSKMSAVKRTTEAIEWREAGGSSIVRKMPGRTKSEPVTLEHGLTHDTQFQDWALQVSNPAGDAAISLKNYRKEVTIEVLNEQGAPAIRFTLHRAWASEFQASPEMDGNANAVAIQMLKLEYEGFEYESIEPTET